MTNIKLNSGLFVDKQENNSIEVLDCVLRERGI
jgi:hypothetical protein